MYLSHSKSDDNDAKVKETASAALRSVRGTLIPIGRSNSHANMATKWRLQMEQNPKVRLPSMVQIKTLVK